MSRWSRSHKHLHQQTGFSLVELITVIIILGILSAVALPRFFRPADFEARFVVDDMKLAMQFAQKRAVNSGCPVEVVLTATGFQLWGDSNCGSSPANFNAVIKHPSDGGAFAVTFPTGVSLISPAPPLTLRFTTFGTITDGTGVQYNPPLTVQISQAGMTRTLTVNGSTGLIE